ncbi:exported hypothetical protein [Cupriavidus taiwanensis]|nr:exported hypothetical protein [Cupriavidus taiwanensis]
MRASACASVVLPTPGTSSSSRWPRASMQASASRTCCGLPRTMRPSWAWASASEATMRGRAVTWDLGAEPEKIAVDAGIIGQRPAHCSGAHRKRDRLLPYAGGRRPGAECRLRMRRLRQMALLLAS